MHHGPAGWVCVGFCHVHTFRWTAVACEWLWERLRCRAKEWVP